MFSHKKDIFFDLDHTLWDFERNAEETLNELYFKYHFDDLFDTNSSQHFIQTYNSHNRRLWALYHHHKIDKATLRRLRFEDTFTALGKDPQLFPWDFEEEYLAICPTKSHLFPNTHNVLTYLKERYNMHLISNGFKDACETKLKNSHLEDYFQSVTISEVIGINKPDPQIFDYALGRVHAQKESSMMIGDNIDADIRGALNFGIDAILFNPTKTSVPADLKHEISDLSELKNYL